MTAEKLRILIVDDSAVIRGLLTKRLAEEPDLRIVGSAIDGVMALAELKKQPVDIVVLDLEMPRMDGFTALPEIRKISPQSKVIISSTLTARNAEISLRALSLGASDCVTKPSSRQDRDALESYYRELIDKTRALGTKVVRAPYIPVPMPNVPSSHPLALAAAVHSFSPPKIPLDARSEMAAGRPTPPGNLLPTLPPQAIAIASSTGGPQALMQIFGEVKTALSAMPVFITQHMPPTFTTILAKHLSQASGADCREAVDGEMVGSGRIYIAPGDFHMRLRKEEGGLCLRLDKEPPINYCRPAADPMIESLVAAYGNRLLLLVLTGMGHDGAAGAKLVSERGGTVVAQDKATSTVWGMPRAVAEQGSCRGLLPLSQFGGYLKSVVDRRPV